MRSRLVARSNFPRLLAGTEEGGGAGGKVSKMATTSPLFHSSYSKSSARVEANNQLSIEMDDMGAIDAAYRSSSGTPGPQLEVWITKSHVMIKKRGESSIDTLWYSREDGSLIVGSSFDVQANSMPTKLCHSFGLIGKLQLLSNAGWYLLLITDARSIGRLPNTKSDVFCIERVVLVPLSVEKSIDEIKMETYAQDRREKDVKDIGKLEKKLKEALLQMFNGSRSFYFSYETDLTQSMQRKHDCGDAVKLRKWQRVDDRFFWNKNMLKDLLDNDKTIDDWVLPVIQGYIEIKNIPIPSADQLGIFLKDRKSHDSHVTTTSLSEDPPQEGVASVIQMQNLLPKNEEYTPPREGVAISYKEKSAEDEDEADYCLLPCSYSSTPLASSLPNELNETLTPSYISHAKPIINAVSSSQTDASSSQTHTISSQIDTVSSHTDAVSSQTDTVSSQIDTVFSDSDLMNATLEESNDSKTTLNERKRKGDELDFESDTPTITMAIISRRSRYRAGTRYLRRGVDKEGYVANYVETEMILLASTHLLSFVVVRGSVPVYWTQPGNKYRPLPIIEQTDEETAGAFEKHFENQINLYKEQVIVNLINQSGRERIVSTAFEKQMIRLDCPLLTYVAFDFHRHCKVNQWHNINLLLSEIEGYITRQKCFWIEVNSDTVKQPLCVQNGVFRVNCMDCLDRTNVVQSVICKEFTQNVLQKLGLISPFTPLSGQFLRHYQELWANNGDTISRQYTGTDAMKGDLTRYGHRRLYGVMKDGYNSAHRYLQSLFRDAYRQVVIDLQQGVSAPEALVSLPRSQKGLVEDDEQVLRQRTYSDLPSWSSQREQLIADMIKTCRDSLFPNTEVPVKGWALVEPAGFSFAPTSNHEEDAVLLLCKERRHICIANYNNDFEQVACCIRIPLDRIERICIGPIGTILRSSRRVYMRLYYTLFPGCSCHFTFRPIRSVSLEEDKLTLLSLSQELTDIQPTIAIQEQRLTKKASRPHEGIVYLIAPSEWAADDWENILSPKTGGGGEGGSIFYDDVTNTSSPLSQQQTGSSRHSSIPSPEEGEVTGTSQSGYETDSSADENDVSFSAPSSPSLSRRTTMMTLKERSRLLSHSSYEDLQTRTEEESRKSASRHKRNESIGYVILNSTSPSIEGYNEDEEDEEIQVDIDQVLSTSRLTSLQDSEAEDLLPNLRERIPSTTTSKSSTSTSPSFSPPPSYISTEKTLLPPSLSPVEAVSSESDTHTGNTSGPTGGATGNTVVASGAPPAASGTGKKYFSRFSKFFRRSQQHQQQHEEGEEMEERNIERSSQFYVPSAIEDSTTSEEGGGGGRGRGRIMKNQAINILKGLKNTTIRDKTATERDEEAAATAVPDEETQWILNAMETSKTRFIII